jgi:hypothetical protein
MARRFYDYATPAYMQQQHANMQQSMMPMMHPPAPVPPFLSSVGPETLGWQHPHQAQEHHSPHLSKHDKSILPKVKLPADPDVVTVEQWQRVMQDVQLDKASVFPPFTTTKPLKSRATVHTQCKSQADSCFCVCVAAVFASSCSARWMVW